MKYSSSLFFLILLRAPPPCELRSVTIKADEALKGEMNQDGIAGSPHVDGNEPIFRNGIGNTHCTVKCESLSVEFWIRFCVMPDSMNDETGW